MFFKVLAFTGLFFAVVNAQGAAWSQCGGIGWTGATTCVSGYVCTVSNPYYSQCIPGTASASSSSPPVASSPVSSPTTPSSTASSPSGTGTAPTPTGSQIRSDQDPAYHLYLQSVDGVPILGNESSCGYFTLGDTITLNNPDGSQLFFNIDDSATTDWKPVSFNATATTTTWGLSGDTIIYGSLQNFLVCPITGSSNFNLFLSTTNNMPSTDCTNYITLHLPCLC